MPPSRTSRRSILWLAVTIIIVGCTVGVIAWWLTAERSPPTDAELATLPIVRTVTEFTDNVLAENFEAASARTTRTSALSKYLPAESQDFRSNGKIVAARYLPIYKWDANGASAWRVDAKMEMSNGKTLLAQFNVSESPPGTFLIYLWGTRPWPESGYELGEATQPAGVPDVQWMPGTRKIDPRKK